MHMSVGSSLWGAVRMHIPGGVKEQERELPNCNAGTRPGRSTETWTEEQSLRVVYMDRRG